MKKWEGGFIDAVVEKVRRREAQKGVDQRLAVEDEFSTLRIKSYVSLFYVFIWDL